MSDKDRIDKLKSALYSRNTDGIDRLHHQGKLHSKEFEVVRDWEHENSDEESADTEGIVGSQIYNLREPLEEPKKSSILFPVIIISFFIFLASAGFAAYTFLKGGNLVSSNNIDISVLGPTSIGAGDELDLDLEITNQNSVALEETDLIITYPEGTRDAVTKENELTEERIPLYSIAPKQKIRQSIKAVLFGEEGANKKIKISLDYRVIGSNSVFSKDRDFDMTINSAPMAFKLDGFDKLNSDQELNLTLTAISNSKTIIKNVALKAEYPLGFSFTSASVDPSLGNSVWNLGDIDPGGTREIKIKGKLTGQDTEEKFFKFHLGTARSDNKNALGAIFVDSSKSVVIERPFITSSLALNQQQTPINIVPNGEPVRGEIEFSNNLRLPINDVKVEVDLSSKLINKKTIKTYNGLFKSDINKLTWTRQEQDNLNELLPSQRNSVSFEFTPTALEFSKNPEFDMSVNLTGKRLSEDNVSEEIVSTIQRKVRLIAQPYISARAVRSVGPFTNTGPDSPKADVASTYTIIWAVTGSYNDITNAKVVAKIPSNVTWLDKVDGVGEAISYNKAERTLTWNLGTIKAVPLNSPPRQVSFQVSLLPSLEQVGSPAPLVTTAQLSGKDTFAGVNVAATSKDLNTTITTDPKFDYGQDFVTE